jgi:hypothetical protein
MTFHVEQPAVIAAADAVLLDLAVIQSRAAVTAARINQPWSALSVAKENQILAHDLHRPWRVAGIGAHADGMPVATQQFAHRRAASHFGELGVVARRL